MIAVRCPPDARRSAAQCDITPASNTWSGRHPSSLAPPHGAQRQRSSFQSRPASSVWQLGTGTRGWVGCGRHACASRSYASTSMLAVPQSPPSK
ncbi:MAG: hypothetical protein E6J87_26205 [Deltaproteobacteria bacterium]|nr:MAG: hypothetical protein E6J87_26205 [Deltaproteobacteria bacterium]